MRIDPFSPVRSAARAARRRRRPRPDAPKTLVPEVETGAARAEGPAGLSLERLDAARDRLRAAIPPRPEDE